MATRSAGQDGWAIRLRAPVGAAGLLLAAVACNRLDSPAENWIEDSCGYMGQAKEAATDGEVKEFNHRLSDAQTVLDPAWEDAAGDPELRQAVHDLGRAYDRLQLTPHRTELPTADEFVGVDSLCADH